MNSSSPVPDPSSPPAAIEAAAAAWLSLRDRGMSADETTDFVRWLQQDPQHAAVFAELDGVWKDFDRLGAVPASMPAGLAPDADLLAPRERPRRHRVIAWGVLGAAAAAVVVLAAFQTRGARHTAETAVGAFQKLDLPDGSIAQLNTDSALDVAFTAAERRVRVVRGEVFFSVAKDPARPFFVAAGPVIVRAVGTAFNVRHRPEAVEVLVTEGRVAVVPSAPPVAASSSSPIPPAVPELSAGERTIVPLAASRAATAPTAPSIERIAAPAVQRALAWQERRLEFDAVPLAEVAREFNRYNRRQLVIADAALAGRRFSGAFRADGYESFVRLLEADFGVTVEHRGREILLHAGR